MKINMKKKLMMILTVAVMITNMALLGACAGETAEPEPVEKEPGTENVTVTSDIPEDSILLFMDNEGGAKLISDMNEGRVPVKCVAMYDEMGSRPEVVLTDPDMITEAYNRLSQMTIGAETEMSVTDSYHYIAFELQDGTTVGWNFESSYLCWGPVNYEISNSGSLWGFIREIQDGMIEN